MNSTDRFRDSIPGPPAELDRVAPIPIANDSISPIIIVTANNGKLVATKRPVIFARIISLPQSLEPRTTIIPLAPP
jgi:hypothetical protein